MSLQAIPEDLLYGLLPESVVELDQRQLLKAVIGGFQDRLEDVRSYAKRYEVFLNPIQTTPEGTTNSLVVELTGDQGKVFQRSVQVDETTPEATDPDGLKTWTAGRLGVEEDVIVSVLYASDPLRQVDINLLEYLATTIGAVIYKTDVTAASVQRQRQLVESYFPRLRSKGTISSFAVLGKLLGFDDVQMTPLWGRVSPRFPNDIGNPVNDPDFGYEAQSEPTTTKSIFYDPNKLDDGPFFRWTSSTLVNASDDPDYYTSINALNPFVTAKVTGTETAPPDAGIYKLEGGGPHTKATVVPAGSGLTFEALAEGDSFNGLAISVVATGSNNGGRQLTIVDRLSSIKYRTSFYNLSLFSDLDNAAESGVISIQRNDDLQNHPTIAGTGTAVSPFYPWSSGTQVGVSEVQLDTDSLGGLGVQASAAFEEVRAATRFPRRVAVGYTSSESAAYAAYPARTDLFVTNAYGSYSGTATGFPLAPYATEVAFQVAYEELVTRPSPLEENLEATLLRIPERGSIVLLQGSVIVGGDDEHGKIVSINLGPELSPGGNWPVVAPLNNPVEALIVVPGLRYRFVIGDSFVLVNGFGGADYFGSTEFIAAQTTVAIYGPLGGGTPRTYSLRLVGPSVISSGTVDYAKKLIKVKVSTTDLSLTCRYQALVPMSAELHPTDTNVVNFSGSGVSGYYSFSNGSFSFREDSIGLPDNRTIAALWSPSSTEIVRIEPSGTLKDIGRVGYQAYPEDAPDFIFQSGTGTATWQLHDEYAWRRPITAGGELVDANLYQPPTADLVSHSAIEVMVAVNHQGVEHDIIGYDDFGPHDLSIPVEPDVDDFMRRVEINGGAVNPRSRKAIYTLVTSLKAAGIWTKIQDMGVFVGTNLNAATTKLKVASGRSPKLVNVGLVAADYSERSASLSGIKGGTGKYINTDVPTNVTMDPNNSHMSYFTGTPFEVNNLVRPMGVIGAANTFGFSKRVANNQQYGHYGTDVADTDVPFGAGGGGPTVSVPVLGAGFYLGQNINGFDQLFKDGVLLAQKSHTPLTIETLTVFLLASNQLGSPVGNTLGTQIQFYSLGQKLTDGEIGIFSRLVAQFQQDVGRYNSDLPIRTTFIERSFAATDYSHGQLAMARSATYLTSGTVLVESSGSLFHAGLVQDVLVADPTSFFQASHREALSGWLMFNEHAEDDLEVRDHSPVASNLELTGILPESRVWDDLRGWHLKLDPGMVLTSSADRGARSEGSISFFIKAGGASTKTVDTTILSFGPISFDLSPDGIKLTCFVENEDNVRVQGASYRLIPGFNHVYALALRNSFTFNVLPAGDQPPQAFLLPNTLTFAVETTIQAGEYEDFTDAVLTVRCDGTSFGIHDLRIWSICKTSSDMRRVVRRPYRPTAVGYSQSCFLTAGRQERWGLRVLDSGLVVPTAVDNIRVEQQKYVQRYGDDGRYTGDVRFKETGLGDGQPFTQPWRIGNRFFNVTAGGKAVISTTHSTLPGFNQAWDTIFSGTGTLLAGGTIAPGLLTHANPIRERMWIEGDDHRMYEVVADDNGVRPLLVATPYFQDREAAEYSTYGSLQHMDQPTGALVQVTSSGSLMSVRLHASGTYEVYQSTRTLPFNRPPVYLYNQTQVAASQSGTLNWENRNDTGVELGVPTIDSPGVISFLNEGTLLPGPHRLDIDSGVIGNPGVGFTGFDMEVTIGPDIVPVTLLKDVTIQDPRQTESVEFDVTRTSIGRWAVEFDWLNNLDIPAQGIFRHPAIYAYTIRRMAPKVYKVATASGSLQPVNISAVPPSSVNLPPGGFLATLSNSGTVDVWQHESQDSMRPADDSFQSKVPLSDLLTTTTEAKREDVIMISYTGSLAPSDPVLPPAPVVTVSQSVADPLRTTWMWSGSVTDSSVNIRARMNGSGYVQAVVSKRSNFTSPILSSPVFATNRFISRAAGFGRNVVSLDVVGLEPDTLYYYAVGDISSPDYTQVGTFKTWPVGQASFAFAMSSSALTGSNHTVFSTIQAQSPLFLLHTGNLHQQAISTDSAGTIVSAGTQFQDAYESVLAAPNQLALYKTTPIVYMWDELDFGPVHSDRTSPGTPSAQSSYRQYVPHYQLVASGTSIPGNPTLVDATTALMVTGPIYQAFTVGRVYFIVTDLRSVRDPIGNTDNATKSMMGAEQKAWFKRQLLDANGKYPLIVWVSTVPWIWDGNTTCDDGWCKFTTERQELANFVKDNAIKGVVVLSGNMHALAADDGTNSDYATSGGAGLPVLHAGALDGTASLKGGPYSEGSVQGSGQFAMITVTDSGTDISVAYSGRDSSNVEQLSFAFNASTYPN